MTKLAKHHMHMCHYTINHHIISHTFLYLFKYNYDFTPTQSLKPSPSKFQWTELCSFCSFAVKNPVKLPIQLNIKKLFLIFNFYFLWSLNAPLSRSSGFWVVWSGLVVSVRQSPFSLSTIPLEQQTTLSFSQTNQVNFNLILVFDMPIITFLELCSLVIAFFLIRVLIFMNFYEFCEFVLKFGFWDVGCVWWDWKCGEMGES